MKLYTILSLSLLVAISNAQSNLYNNNNNDIINNNDNDGQHTHKLALHNHKTINSRYTNLHATDDISNRRLKNRNNNNELSKRDEITKLDRNKREKRETKIGDDIALAIADDYDRKYNNKRAQRKKNELVAVSGNEAESGDKRRHKDKKKNEEESHKVEEYSVEIETPKKKDKKRTSQHTAAQSTKHHTLTTTADTTTTTNEHQKRQKRGKVNYEMINIFQKQISNYSNGSKQYKEDIAVGMSLDYTIPSDMSMGKHAKQSKRHSKSIKSVKSKVDKRPTLSPSMESSSITPTLESSSPTPTSTSSESPTQDESCELYPDQDPTEVCSPDMYCKVECKLKTLPWFGVCTTMPDYCPPYIDPVCGCDFTTTYSNACEASAQGVNVAYDGECDNDDTKPPISSSPTNTPSHGPSSIPSSSPTTMAPTYIPDDSNVTYFQSFEQSFTFPYIDTELTQGYRHRVFWDSFGDMIWMRSDEEIVNGKHSLRNPLLESDEMTRASSSV